MFFKDIIDYKKYVSVTASFKFDEMKIYLNDVDSSVLKKHLGATFLSELQTLFNNESSAEDLESPFKEIVEMLRISSAHLALEKWVPFGQVSISQSGINITSSDTTKTAWEWQVRDIQARCNETGFNALEDALEYLEKNIEEEEFDSYKTSDEFKENNSLFVSSAKEFCRHYSLFSVARHNFYRIRSVIKTVEYFDIKSVILPDYFDSLKDTLKAGEAFEPIDQTIVDMIRPAVVYLTVSKAINELAVSINENGLVIFDNVGGRQTTKSNKQASDSILARIAHNAEVTGRTYLKSLANYLEKHKDQYDLFTNDSLYVDPADETDLNSGDKPFYVGL
jgi:hypothetical protein